MKASRTGARVAAPALIAALCCTVVGQRRFNAKTIEYGKHIEVRALDDSLGEEGFEQWLRRILGSSINVEWELNDCGEQSGGRTDRERHLPVCVQAEAKLAGGRTITLMVIVGTFQRGLIEKPSLFSGWIKEGDDSITLKRLADLPSMLKKTSK